MTQFLQLRASPSGAVFLGVNQNDTVLWDATAKGWFVGPGGGVGGVSSWNGRTGVVVPQTGDYDSDEVGNVSSVVGASVSDALDYLLANAGAVASVFGRVGAVVAATGDYDSDQVDNASGVAGTSVSDALDNLEAEIVAIPIFPVAAATTGNVALTGVLVVDGFAPTNGDLLAVWKQTNANENGVYNYNSAGAWPRDSRWNSVAEFASYQGRSFLVKNGALYSEQIMELTLAPTALGSTPVHFNITSIGDGVKGTSNVPGVTVTAELDYFAKAPADVAGGAAPALDFTLNRYQRITLDQNASPTVTVPPAGIEVLIELIQSGAGSFTVTWPASFRWTDDLPPTLTTTTGKRDLIRAVSNGTQLLGWAQAMNMSA